MRGRGVEVSKTLFYFIGNFACGEILNENGPHGGGHDIIDGVDFRRDRILLHQNRH